MDYFFRCIKNESCELQPTTTLSSFSIGILLSCLTYRYPVYRRMARIKKNPKGIVLIHLFLTFYYIRYYITVCGLHIIYYTQHVLLFAPASLPQPASFAEYRTIQDSAAAPSKIIIIIKMCQSMLYDRLAYSIIHPSVPLSWLRLTFCQA